MPMNTSPGQLPLGLLPEPEGRSASFIVSAGINAAILVVCIAAGMMAKNVIRQHFEQTQLVFPNNPPPTPKVKPLAPVKLPPPPKIQEVKLEAPKIQLPKQQPKPKAIQMEAKLSVPVMKAARPTIIMQPQPKAALTAAMPAQVKQEHASVAPVHLGEIFGVRPNPSASRPATVAAIGNPYGGMNGPAVAPHGVVSSAGIGNGYRRGSNAGIVGEVASAGIPGATANGPGNGDPYGKVESAGIPAAVDSAVIRQTRAEPTSTDLDVISKPPVRYTPEARAKKIQGDVVLRVTFMADGKVVVLGLVHGLGYGLDREAMREAEHIRFRPATRDGHPINLTTQIVITFQLA